MSRSFDILVEKLQALQNLHGFGFMLNVGTLLRMMREAQTEALSEQTQYNTEPRKSYPFHFGLFDDPSDAPLEFKPEQEDQDLGFYDGSLGIPYDPEK